MLKEYIYDKRFQLLIVDNSIDVVNYIDIISFNDKNIIIKCPNYILDIGGTSLIITKLIDTEIIINGQIDSIKFK